METTGMVICEMGSGGLVAPDVNPFTPDDDVGQ